jgi:hypothetical protein
MSRRLPLVGLERAQWRRLYDFAALTALILFLLYIWIEVYVWHGVDFRGYYAAARVALDGGDPYDYRIVSQVLLEMTGDMGNNPYYYPPWFCLAMMPFVLLPFQTGRVVWIGLNVLLFWFGSQLAFDVLDWQIRGWRRWLVILSAAYLLFWLSMRSEQLGTALFFLAVLSLWGYRRRKPWLAGITLALLCTKPNVTWLLVPCLGVFYLKYQRNAAWWAVGTLLGLLVVSTIVFPGWYLHLTEPGFGAGLTIELDGPDRVRSGRLNTVLRDWLKPWAVDEWLYWAIWGSLVVGSAAAMWLAWRNVRDAPYWVSLSAAVGLLVTFYALQYDYPPLILALFWSWHALPKAPKVARWVAGTILAFVLSVPLWEHPVYEGYWILLGVLATLLLLNRDLWRWPWTAEA